MTAALYLHEVIDIVGPGAVPYMEHTVAFDCERGAGRGLALTGTWYVVGATGRWPQVVNLWEIVDGWEGWRRLCDATNLRREANAPLDEWWRQAYQHRTGGYDRLLRAAGPVAAAPAELFVHEVTEVRPGAAGDYLAATVERRAPLLEEYGHRLLGAFEVLLGDTEVVTVWGTTLDDHIRVMQADGAEGDARLLAWRRSAQEHTVRWREELMTPGATSPLAP